MNHYQSSCPNQKQGGHPCHSLALSHHSTLLPGRQPPAHLERCHSLLAGASPILPSHLHNLIYRKKKSSLTKLRAFCRRAEPLSGTTESLICVTYKINYRNPGTAATAHRLPGKPGWPSGPRAGRWRKRRALVTHSLDRGGAGP